MAVGIRSEQLTESDVQLVRLLRNCVPLGGDAVDAILSGGVLAALVQTLRCLEAAGGLQPNNLASSTPPTAAPAGAGPTVGTSFRAACAQLLANVASAGLAGAAEVWARCFPATFLQLLAHPSGQVHKPATLALYACCRQSLHCSRALCAVETYRTPKAHPDDGAAVAAGEQCTAEAAAAAGTESESAGRAADGASGSRASAPSASGQPGTLGAVSRESGCGSGSGSAAAAAAAGGDSTAAVRAIWEALLRRLRPAPEPQPYRETQEGGGGGGGGPDWTALLCGCVALRQGLLSPLMALLAPPPSVPSSERRDGSDVTACTAADGTSAVAEVGGKAAEEASTRDAAAPAATAAPAASAAVVAAVAGASVLRGRAPGCLGPLVPVLLHVSAHEVRELQGGGSVDLSGWDQATAAAAAPAAESVEDGCGAGRGSAAAEATVAAAAEADEAAAGTSGRGAAAPPPPLSALPPAARPVAAALLHVAELVEAVARWLAAEGGDAGEAIESGGRVGGGGGGTGRSTGATAAAAAGVRAPSDAADVALAAAVLEAGLEVLKSVTQREDGCRAFTGGTDMAEWLLCDSGVVLPRILGMLAALQPAPALREARRRRAGGAGGAGSTAAAAAALPPPAAAAASPPPPDRPVVELPYALQALAAGLPSGAPYVGYRGDLVSVLSNGAFRRRRVVSELLAGGGLELLLAQTHLDEHSPLAREWALWGVRNMCEGSEEVQGRISGLQLQTAVETPELQQLGLKLELDKGTGKLKLLMVCSTAGANTRGDIFAALLAALSYVLFWVAVPAGAGNAIDITQTMPGRVYLDLVLKWDEITNPRLDAFVRCYEDPRRPKQATLFPGRCFWPCLQYDMYDELYFNGPGVNGSIGSRQLCPCKYNRPRPYDMKYPVPMPRRAAVTQQALLDWWDTNINEGLSTSRWKAPKWSWQNWLGGDNMRDSLWHPDGSSYCSWPGIECAAGCESTHALAALDFRNSTLYIPQLNFQPFRALSEAERRDVWYINLSYNYIGGTLPADLPDIFPALEHLGLDHCRYVQGGATAEFGWQQFNGAEWRRFGWRNFTGTPEYAAVAAKVAFCKDSDVTPDGRTRFVIRGRIPESWGKWNRTLKTL
ncbi:hypothetical protein PLESTF_001455700 [Pleodorina starrii]|nr:hypothetical protein PLESTF_001455700 [Pleodorina starrii]